MIYAQRYFFSWLFYSNSIYNSCICSKLQCGLLHVECRCNSFNYV